MPKAAVAKDEQARAAALAQHQGTHHRRGASFFFFITLELSDKKSMSLK